MDTPADLRAARADELEASAAATLTRANQLRSGGDEATIEVEYLVKTRAGDCYPDDLDTAEALARNRDGTIYTRTVTTSAWQELPDVR